MVWGYRVLPVMGHHGEGEGNHHPWSPWSPIIYPRQPARVGPPRPAGAGSPDCPPRADRGRHGDGIEMPRSRSISDLANGTSEGSSRPIADDDRRADIWCSV